MTPDLTLVAHLSVAVGEPVDLGELPSGHCRLVPILGGSVGGPIFEGRVLPGGADHQILRSSTLTEVDAKYALETTAGERISVHNCGIRTGDAEDMAALLRGDDVPADRIYFRSFPRLTTAAPRLAWMNERLFVGVGERHPDTVGLDVYRID